MEVLDPVPALARHRLTRRKQVDALGVGLYSLCFHELGTGCPAASWRIGHADGTRAA